MTKIQYIYGLLLGISIVSTQVLAEDVIITYSISASYINPRFNNNCQHLPASKNLAPVSEVKTSFFSKIKNGVTDNRLTNYVSSTVKRHPLKAGAIVGAIGGALIDRYVMPNVIDYTKRAYGWIKSKLSR